MFSCQNPSCADYGLHEAGNLSVCARYGKQRRRLLYCKTCKARFSERKGTALFDSRLPEDKAAAILRYLAEGHGVRKTARLVGVSKDTVVRYGARARQRAPEVEVLAFALGADQGRAAIPGPGPDKPLCEEGLQSRMQA